MATFDNNSLTCPQWMLHFLDINMAKPSNFTLITNALILYPIFFFLLTFASSQSHLSYFPLYGQGTSLALKTINHRI